MNYELIQRIMSGPIAEFLATYKVVIGFLIALLYVLLVVIIAVNLVALSRAPAHPMQRRRIMDSLLISCICLVILSGFTFFYLIILRMAFGPIA